MNNQKLIDAAIAMVASFNSKTGDILRRIPITISSEVPSNSLARYNFVHKFIQINPEVDSIETLAAALVHEGQHALDDERGVLSKDYDNVSAAVNDEVRAYTEDLRFWTNLYPNGKQPAISEAEQSENIWQMAERQGLLRRSVEQSYFPEISAISRVLGISFDEAVK